jgi:hypothetical protein
MSADIEMDSAKTVDETVVIEVIADPGFFRRIEEESKGIFPGSAVEVVSLSVVGEGMSWSLFSSTHEEKGDDDEKEEKDIPKELIEGGNSATGAGSSSLLPSPSSMPLATLSEATAASSRGTGMLVRRVTQPGMRGITCNACSIDFVSMDELKLHHKLDWHRFNLKRKG